MSYNTIKRGARHRIPGGLPSQRIDLGWEYERRDWAKSLGVSEQDLRNAVSAVGNDADKVREYLKHRKYPSR
jgi:hypothetical protein